MFPLYCTVLYVRACCIIVTWRCELGETVACVDDYPPSFSALMIGSSDL